MENKIWTMIDQSHNILIMTHQRPDGDAIGSSLGLYEVLKNMNKNVEVIMQEVPPVFNFLENCSQIKETTNSSFDLAIILDCATKERIGAKEDYLRNIKNTICIDHHMSNTLYGDINLIEANTSSCSQIIYYFLKNHHVEISKNIGEPLLLGVITDTNGFANNNVDTNSLKLASELLAQGINFYETYNKVLRMKTKSQFALHKIATERLELFHNDKIAFTYITKEDIMNNNAKLGEHEGIVEIGRSIEGVEVSVFIREAEKYHISLRSNGRIDVNEVASILGGGGHKMAAGAVSDKTFKETKELIINEIIRKIG